MLDNVLEDEFAFASRVAGIDHFADILAGEKFFQDAKLVLRFLAGDKIEVGGQDGEIFEGPLAADDFEAVGLLNFEEVAHGVRNNHDLTLVVAFLFFEFAEGLGKVASHTGLFCDDEGFGHL